jgi:molybdopterin-biosynthesis enzyme MoeA-like protein
VSSNRKRLSLAWMASWMERICCAMTDSTSRSMRLNSSKQAHAPEEARPLKNLPWSVCSVYGVC